MSNASDWMLDKKLNVYRELLKEEHGYTDAEVDSIINAFDNKQLALAHLRISVHSNFGAFAPPKDLERPKDVEAPPLNHVNETYDPPCVATSLKNFFKRLF